MSFLDSRRVRVFFALLAGLLPVAAGADIGALDFYTLTSIPPCRILDTRLSPPILQAGTPRTISMVGGACGVPADAAAVALNVTVATPTASGDVSLYPSGASVPPASPSIASLPYQTGLNRAKQLLVQLGPTGDLVASASAGQVHLVIDIAGYFLGAKAVADSQTVNEDAAATTISVLANDLNPNGDTLTIASATDPANGTVVIAGDNLSLTYQPDPNYCNNPPGTALDTFTYTINPSGSTATVSVTVDCQNDAPVLTAGGGTPTFTEGGGPIVVDSGLTVADVDDTNLESATVTITNPLDGASEVLAATACAGLTVTPGLNSLSITGSQPLATYQACLRSVTYDNSSVNPDATARVISFVGDDGTASSAAATTTVTISAVNGAPVVTTTVGSTAFTEGGGAVVVDSGVTVTDPDSANLASATVTITNPQDGASEVLAATACAGLTVTPGLNSLSITGSQPPATYQTCLQSVTYDNASEDPGTTARTISFVANDGSVSSTPATKTVTVATVLDAPVVTTTVGTTSFTEDGGAVVVDSGLTVTDADSANLASATVTITNPQDGALEVLAATACAGLTVTPGLNSLSITGSQPPATYQTCLRSVTYDNTDQDPDTTARVISFVANDGSLSSTPATKTVTVAAVADAPVVTTTAGTTSFTEDGGAVVVDSGVTVTDADSANLASATVTITNPQDGAFEVLAASACAGLTVTPGLNSLSITGSQPPATYQTCLQSVTYNNTDQDPGTTARTISFVANDGSVSSTPATKTVTVAAVPDAPVVTTTVGSTSFTEDGGAVVVDSALTVTDADSANLASATVTITNPQDGASEVLAASACAGLTVTPGLNSLSITGSQPPATYQTCLRSVTYNNTDEDPGTTPRTISFVANDGGLSSTPATKTVTVAAVADAPVVTTTVGSTSFTEDGGAVVVDSGVTVTDADSANLASATVTITNPQDGAFEVLAASACAGLTVTPGLNTLSITGSQPLATYQTCLQSVTYDNTDQDPGTTARTISFVANDGSVSSTPATKTVTVTSVPDAPVVTTTVGSTSFTEDGGAVVVDSGLTVTDADSANLASATVAITNPQDGALEVLSASACAGLTVTPGLNTLSITGSQPPATYQTCLRSVAYNNSSQDPNTTARVISFIANDGGLSSTPATKTVTVTAVPDPPVADDDTFDTIGNTELRVDLAAAATPHVLTATGTTRGVLDGDNDVDTPFASLVVSGVVGCGDLTAPFVCATVNGGTVTLEANGRFSFIPKNGDVAASDSFQYTVSDGATSDTGLVTINLLKRAWYVKNDATPGGLGRSTDPFDTLAGAEAASLANDYIFVYLGDGTSTGQAGGIVLKSGQRLLGEHHGLTIQFSPAIIFNGTPGTTSVPLHTGTPGNRPLVDNPGGNAVSATDVIPVEIVGLSLMGSANAVDLTNGVALPASAALAIQDNVVRGAGAEGFDINLNAGTTGTLALNVTGNSWSGAGTHTGNAVDVNRAAGTLNLNFSGNTGIKSNNAAGAAVLINGGAAANTTITGFSSNSVSGDTLGAGVVISNATFDAVAGGAVQQVDGDNLAIGTSVNPVSGAGMSFATVLGNLFFDDLDVYAGTSGLTINGGGMTFAVTPAFPGGSGTSVIQAGNGAALDVTTATVDLRLDDLDSTTSGSGVALSGVGGQLTTDSDASISKTSGAGTAFSVASSSATVDYAGTLNVTSGSGVSLATNSGSTTFRGGMTLSTVASTAFSATGGGTVNVIDPAGIANNTITTTTATALNIAGTTIGASGVTFESINSTTASANTTVVLDNSGSGQFMVTGTGGAGTGGTISNKTVDAITMNNTDGLVTLKNMILQDLGDMGGGFNTISGDDAIHGQQVDGGLTLEGMTIRRISDQAVNGSLFAGGGATVWNGLTITNSTIEDTNRFNVAGVGDANNEGMVRILGIRGTVSITGSTLQRGGELIDFFVTGGTLNMTATTNNFSFAYKEFTSGATASVGGHCVDVTVQNDADANVTLGDRNNDALDNNFLNCRLGSVRVANDSGATGDIDVVLGKNDFTVNDHSSGIGGDFDFPQGGVLIMSRGTDTATFDVVIDGNYFDEVTNASGGVGQVSYDMQNGVWQVLMQNNTFDTPGNAPWFLRADSSASAKILFQNNLGIKGFFTCPDPSCGGGYFGPGLRSLADVQNGGVIDLTIVNDVFAEHDASFDPGQTFEARVLNTGGGGTLCLDLQNNQAPDGYSLEEFAGDFNLVGTGTCPVGNPSPSCQTLLGNRGNRGGSNVATTNPPFVNVEVGASIDVVAAACQQPAGAIF